MTGQQRATITLQVRLAWWFTPYLHILYFFCDLHKTEPKTAHLEWITAKAIRVKRVSRRTLK